MSINLTNEFRKQLVATLREINSNIYCINHGGCGVFAKELANVLISLGYDVKYSLIFYDISSVEKGNECINNKDVSGLYCSGWNHVMLLVNGKYYIDSNGLIGKKGFKKLSVILPLNLFNEFISRKFIHLWNDSFDRRDVVKIRRRLKKLI